MPRDIRELWYGGRHAHRCRFQGRRLQPRDVHRTPRVDQAVRGVVVTDADVPLQFLRRAYHPDDWVAVFLKSYESGRVAQRVAPVSVVMSSPCQAWLARENEAAVNVYIAWNWRVLSFSPDASSVVVQTSERQSDKEVRMTDQDVR